MPLRKVEVWISFVVLQEGLKKCRRSHDLDNQKEESKLDLLLDQLRQGSNEEVGDTLYSHSSTL